MSQQLTVDSQQATLITTRPRGDRLPRTQNRERSSPSVPPLASEASVGGGGLGRKPRTGGSQQRCWLRPPYPSGCAAAVLSPQRSALRPRWRDQQACCASTLQSSVFSRHATLITMRPRSLCFLPSRAKRALGEVAEAKPRTEGAVPTNRARAPPPYPIGCAAAVLSPNGRPYGLAGETNIPLRGPTSRMISGPPWNACSGSTLTAALSQAASALPSRSRHTSPVADYRPASASAFSIRCSLTLPRVPSV